ncbi:hypothetical protein FBZ82_1079 [Azospirillum brasilense]|uniref:Uncharacterized protein n=1 Tax=Azospirillum brasilense TaxID=192 RepID=A0A560B325_AZOBR|nr:hypothetical protein [Azospirillum brasilense]TWA67038.1 hypothetical protein FBZ82_1079 [Azospirillum brasilense]
MSISSVTSSAASGIAQQRPSGPGKEMREGLHQLKDAVTSGALDSIQSAYEPLTRMLTAVDEALQTGASSSSSTSSSSTSVAELFRTALQSMSSALQSGDLTGAQKAFSSLAPRGSQGADLLA